MGKEWHSLGYFLDRKSKFQYFFELYCLNFDNETETTNKMRLDIPKYYANGIEIILKWYQFFVSEENELMKRTSGMKPVDFQFPAWSRGMRHSIENWAVFCTRRCSLYVNAGQNTAAAALMTYSCLKQCLIFWRYCLNFVFKAISHLL